MANYILKKEVDLYIRDEETKEFVREDTLISEDVFWYDEFMTFMHHYLEKFRITEARMSLAFDIL